MNTYKYMHMNTHAHIQIHVWTHIQIHTRAHRNIYTHEHMHTYRRTQRNTYTNTHTRFHYPFVMKQTFRLLIFLGNCKKNVSVSKAAKMCPWDTNVLSFRHMPRSGFILNSLRRSRIVFRGGYSTVYLQQYFSKVACPYSPTFVALRAAFCLWHLMCMLFSAWVLWCIMIFHPLGFVF